MMISPKTNIKFLIGILFLGLLIFLVYQPVIHGQWLWDDDDLVSENMSLRSVEGLREIWIKPGATPQYYPLTFTVFWLQYQVWGPEPAGYHLVNILLHFLNAALIWILLKRLKIPWAYGAALIFAVHPVNVETVAWISELKNAMMVLLYLLTLLSYFQYRDVSSLGSRDQGRHFYYFLAIFFFTFSLLSKTTAATLPIVIIILFWWRRGKVEKRILLEMIPFFLIGLLAGSFTVFCEKVFVGARGELWQFSFLDRLVIAGRALWFYPWKIFWPTNLSFFYQPWVINSSNAGSYIYGFGFLCLIFSLFFLRKRIGRGPLAAVMFYAITIFPALGFFDIETMLYSFVADHYQYLACLGWIVLFLAGAHYIISKQGKFLKRASVAGLIVIVVLLSFLTNQQARLYQTQLDLYKDVVSKNPKCWLAYNNLGCIYSRQSRYEVAIAYFDKAIEINPTIYLAFRNRAIAHLNLKHYHKAVLDAKKAIHLRPVAQAFDLLGFIYFKQQMWDKALQAYDIVIKINPKFIESLIVRGEIYSHQGKSDLAIKDLDVVVQEQPNYCYAYQLKSSIYKKQGNLSKSMLEKRIAKRFGCTHW